MGWPVLACTAPPGYVANSDDCDDWSITYEDLDGDGFGNPAVQVACGSYDNTDCDDTQMTYADNDGDNFGDPNSIVLVVLLIILIVMTIMPVLVVELS